MFTTYIIISIILFSFLVTLYEGLYMNIDDSIIKNIITNTTVYSLILFASLLWLPAVILSLIAFVVILLFKLIKKII